MSNFLLSIINIIFFISYFNKKELLGVFCIAETLRISEKLFNPKPKTIIFAV
jgi:hypothetical protein